jgi:hypothetical protein
MYTAVVWAVEVRTAAVVINIKFEHNIAGEMRRRAEWQTGAVSH